MTNELMSFDNNQIVVKQGLVEFNGFEQLKEQALLLSEQISQVEVTEETVKASKKMLAAVNSKIKEMEDRRISIKKEMLEPYNEFEQQVKEIVTIVKSADQLVRDQVKDLEEQEREQKREAIQDIFEKRMKQYSFGNLFTFDSFINSKHLNKFTSMKSVELEMVQWFEKIDTDLNVIKTLPNADKVLTEYVDTKDVGLAIKVVNDQEERLKRVVQEAPVVKKAQTVNYLITVFDEKDMTLLEMFMKQNNIKHKIEKR